MSLFRKSEALKRSEKLLADRRAKVQKNINESNRVMDEFKNRMTPKQREKYEELKSKEVKMNNIKSHPEEHISEIKVEGRIFLPHPMNKEEATEYISKILNETELKYDFDLKKSTKNKGVDGCLIIFIIFIIVAAIGGSLILSDIIETSNAIIDKFLSM